jgi:hypothetical protein
MVLSGYIGLATCGLMQLLIDTEIIKGIVVLVEFVFIDPNISKTVENRRQDGDTREIPPKHKPSSQSTEKRAHLNTIK